MCAGAGGGQWCHGLMCHTHWHIIIRIFLTNITLALLGIYGDGYARMSNRCNNLTTTNFVSENLMFSKASYWNCWDSSSSQLQWVLCQFLEYPSGAVYPPNDCDVDVNCCLATVLLPDICVGGGRQHLQWSGMDTIWETSDLKYRGNHLMGGAQSNMSDRLLQSVVALCLQINLKSLNKISLTTTTHPGIDKVSIVIV